MHHSSTRLIGALFLFIVALSLQGGVSKAHADAWCAIPGAGGGCPLIEVQETLCTQQCGPEFIPRWCANQPPNEWTLWCGPVDETK
jgi:hypothetical protein